MYKRAMTILISFLSCCAMICVGFSAWTFNLGQDLQAESNGVIQSEDVIVSDDYVKINEVKMENLNAQTFKISPYGFVITEGDTTSIRYTGTLQIPLIIYKKKCFDFSASQLLVNITVSTKDKTNIQRLSNFISPSCDSGSDIVSDMHGKAYTTEYVISFLLNTSSFEGADDSETESLTVKLAFNLEHLSIYTYYLYNSDFVKGEDIVNPFVFVVAVSDKIPKEGN